MCWKMSSDDEVSKHAKYTGEVKLGLGVVKLTTQSLKPKF